MGDNSKSYSGSDDRTVPVRSSALCPCRFQVSTAVLTVSLLIAMIHIPAVENMKTRLDKALTMERAIPSTRYARSNKNNPTTSNRLTTSKQQ
jgi:short subunit fatty acids transporter